MLPRLVTDSARPVNAGLGERTPRPFGGPPDEFAADKDKYGQDKPCIKILGCRTRGKKDDRSVHRQIKRTGVAAMGTSTASRIKKARSLHPD